MISNKDIACACCLALKNKSPSEQSAVLKKIVQFLARKRLLSRFPGILSNLEKILNEEDGRIVATVKSARKLEQRAIDQLEKFLKKRYSAKKVILDENLDKNLLGGVRIEANNEVIDLSVRNKMKKLEEYLIRK